MSQMFWGTQPISGRQLSFFRQGSPLEQSRWPISMQFPLRQMASRQGLLPTHCLPSLTGLPELQTPLPSQRPDSWQVVGGTQTTPAGRALPTTQRPATSQMSGPMQGLSLSRHGVPGVAAAPGTQAPVASQVLLPMHRFAVSSHTVPTGRREPGLQAPMPSQVFGLRQRSVGTGPQTVPAGRGTTLTQFPPRHTPVPRQAPGGWQTVSSGHAAQMESARAGFAENRSTIKHIFLMPRISERAEDPLSQQAPFGYLEDVATESGEPGGGAIAKPGARSRKRSARAW